MQREDFIFCIGFEGSTAIIDGRMLRLHHGASTRQLAEAGLYKQALSSAVFAGASQELEEILALFNQKTPSTVGSVAELLRVFGVSGIPEGVKKISVV